MFRKFYTSFVISTLLVLGAHSSHAQFLGVSADAAFNYSSVDSVSGATVGLTHPIPFVPNLGATGFFFDQTEEGSTNATGSRFDLATKVQASTIHFFYHIPLIPVVSITVGLGAGSAELKTDILQFGNGVKFGRLDTVSTRSPLGEALVRVGLPVMPFLEIHLGFHHIVFSEVDLLEDSDLNVEGVETEVDYSGGLATIGIQIAI